ncbi:hypothetical protein NMY22_g215 [Coprinellus aureogranulatus]|nr:hypothetical protein NMY22_g215 [Coprinellus aureogranulatus]
MSYALPLELILLIISTMDGDVDEESLKNFSLTSSAFCIPCQTILFSHVRIKNLLNAPQRSSECALDFLKVYDWLYLDIIVTYLLNPLFRVRVDRLHTLHVRISGVLDHAPISALIESCRSSLETFILEPGTGLGHSGWTGDMDPLSIRNCPSLTALHLKVDAEQPDRARHLVAYVPPSDTLQEVYLDLSFHLKEAHGLWCSGRTSVLHTIGNNVAHQPHFPQLKALRVRICIPNLPEDGIRIVHEWAMRELSAPHERNFLQLSVSPSKFRKDFQSKMNTNRHAIL